MSNHSLSSLMGLVTDEQTGRVLAGRVCSHCEQERGEAAFVRAYLCKVMKVNDISHGICPTHCQIERAKLLGERDELDELIAAIQAPAARLRATYSDEEREIYA